MALFLISATKNVFVTTPLQLDIPKYFPTPSKNIFAKNKITEEGFQLGKKLFYDTQLSVDGTTSCGSCHQPFAAFATYDHDFSHGVNNKFSTRNAPSLVNLAWMSNMHWDGAINNLEVQPLAPITDSNEMGETLPNVLLKLKKDTSYRRYFKNAFGDATVTSERMLKALAQFMGTLISANSKYDQVRKGSAQFIAPEAAGYEIFKQHCNTCHKEPLFTDNSFRNNGMPINKLGDVGRQKITQQPSDALKFKVPTLRNVGVTIPYMHDGRMLTLELVVNHYTNIDTTLQNLDPILKKRIQLTEREKKQLILFLYTLTDTSFTRNKRFLPDIVQNFENHR